LSPTIPAEVSVAYLASVVIPIAVRRSFIGFGLPKAYSYPATSEITVFTYLSIALSDASKSAVVTFFKGFKKSWYPARVATPFWMILYGTGLSVRVTCTCETGANKEALSYA
jgi:hypothetical protein